MKNKIGKLTFHSFLRISMISLCILVLLLGSFMFYLYGATKKNHKIVNDDMNLIFASNILQEGSDRLSKNVRLFVLSKDRNYAENYIFEAFEKDTRGQVVAMLNSLDTNFYYEKLMDIKVLSDELMEIELWLMRLVYESEGLSPIPQKVLDVKLTQEQLNMSSADKYLLAKNYLLNGDYDIFKNEIDLNLQAFNNELEVEFQKNIDKTNQSNKVFFLLGVVIFLLFLGWSIAILIVLNDKIIKPMLKYFKTYKDFDSSHDELLLVNPHGMKEIAQLGEVYNKAIVSLNKLNLSIAEKNVELEMQKNIDPLTGAYNRAFFETNLWLNIKNTEYTLFSIDINYFKQINDNYGHMMGDKVLKFLVDKLKDCIRKSDIIIRMGGDEILLVVKETKDTKVIELLKNRLESLQGSIVAFDEKQVNVSFAYGYAVHNNLTNTFDETLHLADKRMYENKNKNR